MYLLSDVMGTGQPETSALRTEPAGAPGQEAGDHLVMGIPPLMREAGPAPRPGVYSPVRIGENR